MFELLDLSITIWSCSTNFTNYIVEGIGTFSFLLKLLSSCDCSATLHRETLVTRELLVAKETLDQR